MSKYKPKRLFLSVTTSILALFFILGDRKMLCFNRKLELMFFTACSCVVSQTHRSVEPKPFFIFVGNGFTGLD